MDRFSWTRHSEPRYLISCNPKGWRWPGIAIATAGVQCTTSTPYAGVRRTVRAATARVAPRAAAPARARVRRPPVRSIRTDARCVEERACTAPYIAPYVGD